MSAKKVAIKLVRNLFSDAYQTRKIVSEL